MSDRAKFEQMLELLINEDRERAEELFHELVVSKSREIYESILDQAAADADVDEAYSISEIGGDSTDDFLGDIGADDDTDDTTDGDDTFGADDDVLGDGDGDEPATKDDVLDIKDALEDLRAEFESLLSGDNFAGSDSDSDSDSDTDSDTDADSDTDSDDETQESFMREYVEKVNAGHGAEKKGAGESNVNAKSPVAGKNDMGGTTANIARGGEGSTKGTAGGLLNPAAKDLASGNVNTPGSKTATKLSNVAKGHGAEKKGAGESGVDATSIIGSRS